MIDFLPSLNAVLNSTSALLLLIGHHHIKKGKYITHKRFMIAAFTVSSLFLCSYLLYHAYHGTTHFAGEGWSRPVYYTILTSHTLLAVLTLPLAIVTLRYGLKDNKVRHRRIARITYPVWLYVSITGVIIYLILYHLYPAVP
jgi:putative membrane protein